MTLPNPSQSLWDFALSFYAQAGVAETCVRLQDTYGVNVCLLIALRWLDERQQQLSAAQLAALQQHIQPWTQQLVVPLRALRRQLKQPIANAPQDELQEQIRSSIKQAELLAEKKLLLLLEAWLMQAMNNSQAQLANNLEVYLQAQGVAEDVLAVLSGRA